jgi:DNA repair photolyase
MKEFKSFYKANKSRKYNTWCKHGTRLETYGCGCQHDCKYCYAKALLNFRGNWSSDSPAISDINKIERKIKTLSRKTVLRIGVMTDCFQPIEKEHRITLRTIKLLNKYQIPYLITTKSALVANDEYIQIYDKKLAHFQVSITFTNDEQCSLYENASSPTERILAVEKLYRNGFDVSVRLSPFIPEFIDTNIINNINCNKILIEFLKVNHWIRKCFNIDYSAYTHKFGGYDHLPLDEKIRLVNQITGFDQVSVGEYVKEHYLYFRENVNHNKSDCCNLTIRRKHSGIDNVHYVCYHHKQMEVISLNEVPFMLWLTEELHLKIKVYAAQHRLPMRNVIIEAIKQYMTEDHYASGNDSSEPDKNSAV